MTVIPNESNEMNESLNSAHTIIYGETGKASLREGRVGLYYTIADEEAAEVAERLGKELSSKGISITLRNSSLQREFPNRGDAWYKALINSVDRTDVVVIVVGRKYSSWPQANALNVDPSDRSSPQLLFEYLVENGKRVLCVLTVGAHDTSEPAQANFIKFIQKAGQPLPYDVRAEAESQRVWWVDLQLGVQELVMRSHIVDTLVRWSDPKPPKLPPAPRSFQAISTRMISDAPVDDNKDDLLNYHTYASALVSLIDNPQTLTPLTIVINAPWGAGKSSLANLIVRQLVSKPAAGGITPHVVCQFNAWMNDDAENLGASLVAEVARVADAKRPFWRRHLRPLPMSLLPVSDRGPRRLFRLLQLLLVTSLLVFPVFTYRHYVHNSHPATQTTTQPPAANTQPSSVTAGTEKSAGTDDKKTQDKEKPTEDDITQYLALFGSLGGALGAIWLVIEKSYKVVSAVAKFVECPQDEASSGSMSKVREQLGTFIKEGTPKGSRFVIFIDDLERCRPPKAMDVLEAVSQLLGHKNIVVVLIADVEALAINAEIKYDALAKRYSPVVPNAGTDQAVSQPFGRLYLQKFIQLQFDLPHTSIRQMQEYVQRLSEARKPDAPSKPISKPPSLPSRFQPVIAVIKDPMRFAWTTEAHPIVGALRRRWTRWSVFSVLLKSLAVSFLPVWWLAIFAVRTGYPVRERLTSERYTRVIRISSWISIPLGLGVMFWLVFASIFVVGIISPQARIALATQELKSLHDFAGLFVAMLIVGAIFSAVFFVALYVPAIIQYTRDAKTLGQYRKDVSEQLQDPAKLISGARERELSPTVMESVRREQQAIYLQNESKLFTDARDAVITELLPIPRHVKRVLNRLRLIILIMYERQLFNDDQFDGKCVGKWVAIQERWPELANQVTRNSELMSTIETLARRNEDFKSFFNGLKPHIPKGFAIEQNLYTLMKTEPELSRWVGQMTLFIPTEK